MSNNDQIAFKHEWYLVAVFNFALIAIPLFIWFTIEAFFFYAGSDVVEYRIVSLAGLMFSPMFFLGRIYMGDIHVDDGGIGWWAWGRRWRYIRWTDVKTLTVKTIVVRNETPPKQTIYSLYKTDKTPSAFHMLRFDDQIPNAKALIDAVDRYVRQHNILVLDRRGKTEVRRSSIK